MPGMRRILRDITTRVSGTLVPLRDQASSSEPTPEPPLAPPSGPAEAPVQAEAAPVVPDTGAVLTSTDPDPATGPAAALTADAAAPDPALVAAVDLARGVAREVGGSAVGEHLGAVADDALVVTHSFASTDPAYVSWQWAVTVARADGTDTVTVDEVVLLPGVGALVAPAWVPYSDRVEPQDLSPGDLLPPAADDARLVPAYADPEAELAAEAFWELGLGRPRVLSQDGRDDAAERWYDGDRGPLAPMARQAPGKCLDCGFRVGLAGSLRAVFGVCANGQSPDDGRVVSLDHGCGAHSETAVELTHASTLPLVVSGDDDLEITEGGPVGEAPNSEAPNSEAPNTEAPDDETPDGHAS